MKTQGNRGNLLQATYYQNFADTIGIFWHFHKERLNSGNIPFASVSFASGRPPIGFDPDLRYESQRKSSHVKYEILSDFAHATSNTLIGSWKQFVGGLGLQTSPDVLDTIPVPQRQMRYFTDDVRGLAERTERLAMLMHPTDDDISVSSIGADGGFTGAESTVQLQALLGKQFTPRASLMLSKISLANLGLGTSEIGLTDVAQDGSVRHEANYQLLDDSSLGLNTKRLRELGLGSMLGCPAGMPISGEAKRFLESIEATVGDETMLAEFTGMMPTQFENYVVKWYNRLSPEAKIIYINPEDRAILEGEVKRERIAEIQEIRANSAHKER